MEKSINIYTRTDNKSSANSKISWSNQVHHEKRVARAEIIQSASLTYTHIEPVDTWQSHVDQEHNAEFYTVTLDTFQS